MRRLGPLVLIGLLALAGRPLLAADPAASIAIDSAGKSVAVTADDLAQLPQTTVAVAFAGHAAESFAGPLLWAVLGRAGVLAAGTPRDQARRAVLATGSDGYAALLAFGEIAPDLEGKPVILATSLNGQPLGAGHLRIAVPGDKHGARSVHDLVRLTLIDPPAR